MLHVNHATGIDAALRFLPWEIQELYRSEIDFHLTGSRLFGRVPGDSSVPDWDFFAQDQLATRVWLERYHWEEVEDRDYILDPNLSALFSREDINGDHVAHVQLVSDADLKIRCQRAILNRISNFSSLPKVTRNSIWRMLTEELTK